MPLRPSELGAEIRAARKTKGMGLRELARAIGKSPAFVTRIECDPVFPAASPETLRAIAKELEISEDSLLVRAGRTAEVDPTSELELTLYRRVRQMPKAEQQKLLESLSKQAKQS